MYNKTELDISDKIYYCTIILYDLLITPKKPHVFGYPFENYPETLIKRPRNIFLTTTYGRPLAGTC